MVSLEEYDGKELILIKVLAGSKQPYIFDGSIYYRRSTNTVKATSKEISVLIHNRHTTAVHWERQPALGVSWEDLDVDEIYKTMSASRAENRTKDNEHGPMDFLSHFGLFENGYFTNAAVILFAKNPARFIPQSRARIAFLSEGKTSDIYRDDRVLEGNLFSNINTIQSFFEQHLAITSSFAKNDWMRKDNYRIPMSALREGVLNALVHRNYSNPSTTMSILIYPSKLEISNSGKSPLKAADFRKNHLSMPANPDIAHVVFLRGYIEKLGRGTLKILEECKEAGLAPPVWEIDDKSVKLTFLTPPNLDKVISKPVKDELFMAIDKVSQESEAVKARLVKISRMILENPGTKTSELMLSIDISERILRKNIKTLVDAELLSYEGSKKTGGYYPTTTLMGYI